MSKLIRTNTEDNDSLEYYIKDIQNIPLLTREEEIETAREATNGNKAARDKLVKANLRFVITIAKKYQGQGLPLADLISEGNLGLLSAIEHYDVDRGFHFITYAVWWIRQTIIRAINDKVRMIRLPSCQTAQVLKMEKTRSMVQKSQIITEDDIVEIGRMLDMDANKVRELLALQKEVLSLQQPIGNDHLEIGDLVQDNSAMPPEQYLIANSLQDDIEKLLKTLPEREALIIRARYGIGIGTPMSLTEIGLNFNLSKERVRQLEAKAIETLKVPLQLYGYHNYVA